MCVAASGLINRGDGSDGGKRLREIIEFVCLPGPFTRPESRTIDRPAFLASSLLSSHIDSSTRTGGGRRKKMLSQARRTVVETRSLFPSRIRL